MAGEITGETIKSAIAIKVHNTFAVTNGTPPITTYPTIYKEKIIQDMNKPCFFIWIMEGGSEKRMNDNYDLTYQMNIRYHPKDHDEKAYENLSHIAIDLVEALSSIEVPILVNDIPVDKKVRGTQITYEIVDGVLQFYVTYKLKAFIPQTSGPAMGDLKFI